MNEQLKSISYAKDNRRRFQVRINVLEAAIKADRLSLNDPRSYQGNQTYREEILERIDLLESAKKVAIDYKDAFGKGFIQTGGRPRKNRETQVNS